jgi:hypothetical protein
MINFMLTIPFYCADELTMMPPAKAVAGCAFAIATPETNVILIFCIEEPAPPQISGAL